MLGFIWLLILLLLLYGFWKCRRPDQFPPGPWILPFIGNVLQLDLWNMLNTIDQFAKKYGPVYSVYIAGRPLVFVHGFPAAKEVLVTKGTEFADRAANDAVEVTHKKKGIITAGYGEAWKEQRRFALTVLKNFGLGKRSVEERILEEAGNLIQAFTENKSGPFDPFVFTASSVTNVICSLVFGKRYEYGDQKLRNVLDHLPQYMRMIVGPWAWVYNSVPIARGLPLPHQKMFKMAEKVSAFITAEVEDHKATFMTGNHRDFVDAYLEEMQKNKRSSFEEENLVLTVFDLFSAGSETTTSTIQWGLLYMMAFPDIQEKCQREIDSVLGNTAHLTYEDRERLPYTNAVIHEIQRVSAVVSLSIDHAPIKDTLLWGYRIPKGTLILVNIASVLSDESQWKHPREFNPSNFLNEEGEFMKPEAFLAFSAGPRICLGESLARMEIFLFFTSILRHFKVVWPDESSAPDLTPQFGVTMVPRRFKILLESR